MSHADEAANAAQNPSPQSLADRKPRDWPLVVGMVAVALALLLALLYAAWWFVASYWFD
jgi:hypothetical protein